MEYSDILHDIKHVALPHNVRTMRMTNSSSRLLFTSNAIYASTEFEEDIMLLLTNNLKDPNRVFQYVVRALIKGEINDVDLGTMYLEMRGKNLEISALYGNEIREEFIIFENELKNLLKYSENG